MSGFPPLPKATPKLAEARFAREGGSRTSPPNRFRQGYGGPPKLYAKAEGGHYCKVGADRATVVNKVQALTLRS